MKEIYFLNETSQFYLVFDLVIVLTMHSILYVRQLFVALTVTIFKINKIVLKWELFFVWIGYNIGFTSMQVLALSIQ